MKNKFSIFGDDMSIKPEEPEISEQELIIKKWTPILDVLDIEEKDKLKIAEYGEHFMELEEQFRLDPNHDVLQKSLLPLNLKALKELHNYTITKDSTIVEDYTFTIDFPHTPVEMEEMGLNIVEVIEESIRNIVIQELQNRDIVIYLLISNMRMIETEDAAKVSISTKIKIN